nr:YbaB/EbfC family nucleoid-associated protein [Succiniclasticum ruminis]
MGGMGNMQGMLQKVQKMQAEMQKVQAELQARTFESTSGGGAVKVTVTGKKELTGVVIDPQVVDPEDVEMLQDLILAAVNEALHQVDTVTEAEMNKVTGGLKIPGM